MHQYTAAIQELVRVKGLWLIPLFPALGAAINLIFGALIQRRWGKRPIHVIAIGSMVAASVTALWFFFGLLLPLDPARRFLLDEAFRMIDIGAVRVNMAFAMDPLGGVMATMVTVVATAIHIYSTGYMKEGESHWRYFGYLNLFCFAMLLLVLGDNFIVMFFGWEGVGLCSYLLIGFWYKERAKATAGMKAFVVNRIGDFGFIVGMFTLFWGLLGVWEATPGKLELVDDGRCLTVQTAAWPQGAHGKAGKAGDHGKPAEHGRPGEHGKHGKHGAQSQFPDLPAPQAALAARLSAGIIGTAHAAGHPSRSGTPAAEQRGRCGLAVAGQRFKVQAPPQPGQLQQVYIGPTVSFREIKDQLSVEDPSIDDPQQRRVVAWQLASGELFGIGLLIFVTFGFFLGATGKSAQIPLYTWLPDAMAGPTPVSALIHAATMVTAGVYMVARLNFIFILSPEGMSAVALVGAATALAAATMGLFQYDIKKVLAYSTVSQLGFMFVGVGVGAYWVGIYHLLTHAFFKACLFLGSGSVIHGMHYIEHAHGPASLDLRQRPDPRDPQDMRNMGGLATRMPSTRRTYLIACLAIAGIPGFSGFFSKDEILWQAFSSGNIAIKNILIWGMCAAAALCTAFYMFRSYYLTFYGQPPSEGHLEHVKESPRSMTWVLWFLAGGAIVTGLLGLPKLWTGHEPVFEQLLAPTTALSDAFQRAPRSHGHTLEWGLMLLSVALAAAGILIARYWYKDLGKRQVRIANLKQSYQALHTLLYHKYYVDEIYHLLAVRPFIAFSRVLAWFDLRVVDGLVNATAYGLRLLAALGGAIDRVIVDGAVNGVADAIIAGGRRIRRVQTGRINTYVMGIAFGVVILLFIVWIVTPVGGK